jgi:hypothetical protein
VDKKVNPSATAYYSKQAIKSTWQNKDKLRWCTIVRLTRGCPKSVCAIETKSFSSLREKHGIDREI